MKNELFKFNENINVFTINWSSKGMYVNVIKKISETSQEINRILLSLYENGFLIKSSNFVNIHCIGHSLGNF